MLTKDWRPPTPSTQFAPLYLLVILVGIGFVSLIVLMPKGNVQLFLMLLLLFPALILALTESKYLLPYVMGLWVCTSEIRRISDWTSGKYESINLLSLVPIIATSCLCIVHMQRSMYLSKPLKKGIACLLVALGYGSFIGILLNGMASLFELANYAVPVLILFYTATRPPDTQERDFWIKSISTIAIIVAAYGWIQFLYLPEWDVFWMKHVEMGAIGTPVPLKVRVFATMNSPGVAAYFLVAVLGAMLVEKRWRSLGWAGVLVVASGLAITLVRASWFMLIVWLLTYVITGTGTQRWKQALKIFFPSLILIFIIPYLPGGSAVVARTQTLTRLSKDGSLYARSAVSTGFMGRLLVSPFGRGIGSTGTATKLSNSGKLDTETGVIDNGYISLIFTFGLWGAALLFFSFWHMRNALNSAAKNYPPLVDYARLGRAMLMSTLVGLFFGNGLPGLGSMLLWFFVGITVAHPQPDKNNLSVLRKTL